MKNNLIKKYIIRIPNNVTIFCTANNTVTVVGPLGIKSMQLKTKIIVSNKEKFVLVTRLPLNKLSGNAKKKLKFLQGTFVALLRQIVNEVIRKAKKKLYMVGVGYRATIIKKLNFNILHLKLGYSHQLYCKISKDLTIVCPKPTKILILGNCQQKVNKLAALIKSYKIPEPYKGKGILYENEKIILKESKKV